MAVKTMTVIQKILDHLDESMDVEVVDTTPISWSVLGISEARWTRIITMMLEEGLIDGYISARSLGSPAYGEYIEDDPRITLKGIQFLSENSNAAKIWRAAKEIKDLIPGL